VNAATRFTSLYTSIRETISENQAEIAASMRQESRLSNQRTNWLMDSAGSRHWVNDLSLLDEYEDVTPFTIRSTNGGSAVTRTGKMTIAVVSPHGSITQIQLTDVMHCPNAESNAISAIGWEEEGFITDLEHAYLKQNGQILSELVKKDKVAWLPILRKNGDGARHSPNEQSGHDEDEQFPNEDGQMRNDRDVGEQKHGKERSFERVFMGTTQSTPQRTPVGVPGAIYEGTTLEQELRRDSTRFRGYPCVCRETFTPPVQSARQDLENGIGLAMTEGQEAVVLGVDVAFKNGKPEFWVRVRFINHLRQLGTVTDDQKGWVPFWILKIGTYHKNGDAHVEYRDAPLREAGWDGTVQGAENTQFGRAVGAQLAGYWSYSGKQGKLPIGESARHSYLSPTEAPRTTRQIVECVNDSDPAMLAALNTPGVNWRAVAAAVGGPRMRRQDRTAQSWRSTDTRASVYAIFYWDFDDDDDKVFVYIGQSTSFGRRQDEHEADAADNPNSNHYKARLAARQSKAVILAQCSSAALRDIIEQVFVDLFSASCLEVLRDSAAEMEEQTDNATVRVEKETVEGSAEFEDDNDEEDAEGGDFVERAEVDDTIAPAQPAERTYDRAAARAFREVALEAAGNSGWGGLQGISGGCNWKSPLGSSNTSKTIWLRSLQPNNYIEYRRPQKAAQPGPDKDRNVIKFVSKPTPGFNDRKVQLVMSKKNKDWPAGGQYSVVIELSPPGTVHEHRWLTSALDGPMSDSAHIHRLAIRYEYEFTRNGVTYLKFQYLKSFNSSTIVECSTGARKGYIYASAIIRFLQQQKFSPNAVVPSWMCSFGRARVLSVERDFLTQTCYLTTPRWPEDIAVPTVRPRAEVEHLHQSKLRTTNVTTAGQTRQMDHGTFPGRRVKCDNCCDLSPRYGFPEKISLSPCERSGETDVIRCNECLVDGIRCFITNPMRRYAEMPEYVLSLRGVPVGAMSEANAMRGIEDRPNLDIRTFGD